MDRTRTPSERPAWSIPTPLASGAMPNRRPTTRAVACFLLLVLALFGAACRTDVDVLIKVKPGGAGTVTVTADLDAAAAAAARERRARFSLVKAASGPFLIDETRFTPSCKSD